MTLTDKLTLLFCHGSIDEMSPEEITAAVFSEIENAGLALVKRNPSAKVLADTMMNAVTYDPDAKDYAITGAVLELLPPTGHPDARLVIAELSREYRAMIKATGAQS